MNLVHYEEVAISSNFSSCIRVQRYETILNCKLILSFFLWQCWITRLIMAKPYLHHYLL